jgi:hypothetical protein
MSNNKPMSRRKEKAIAYKEEKKRSIIENEELINVMIIELEKPEDMSLSTFLFLSHTFHKEKIEQLIEKQELKRQLENF